jgi:hypothetical protein
MDRDEEFDRRLRAIEERLTILEYGGKAAAFVIEEKAPALPLQSRAKEAFDSFSLAGRSILILGGAFLLRAPTDAAVLPRTAGVAIGLLYAAAWIVFAIRSARNEQRMASIFYAVPAAAIAYPIIWEATTRFGVFNAVVAAVALTIVSIVYLVIANIYSLQSLAWIAAAGATFTAVLLAWATKSMIPFVLELTIAGLAALILAMPQVGWLLALESDLLVAVMIGLTLLDPSHESRAGVVTCLLLFSVAWIATGNTASIQAAIASLIGIAGASALVLQAPARTIVWGAAAVIAAEIARRKSWRVFSWQSALWAALAISNGGVWSWSIAGALSLVAFMRERNIALLAITAYGGVALALHVTTTSLVQTAILAIAAVLLAVIGRVMRLQEASQLAILLLIVTGGKIVVFDLRAGAAVTMFASLVVYGGAVLAIARLRRVAVIS